MSSTSGLVILLALILGSTSAAVASARFIRAWRRARGARVITCPETGRPAAVTLDAVDAGLAAAINERSFHLQSCSRWPERQGCNQACLVQIAEAPDGCLARTRVTKWYEGKQCVLCRKPIDASNLRHHPPALLTPAGFTRLWVDVPIERLPEVFESHEAVCWDCHVAERFRRRFSAIVVDRNETTGRERLYH